MTKYYIVTADKKRHEVMATSQAIAESTLIKTTSYTRTDIRMIYSINASMGIEGQLFSPSKAQ